jgi:hypothetical protein
LVMMTVKKPSKSPSPEWRAGSCSPENKDHDGGGALGLKKIRPSGK